MKHVLRILACAAPGLLSAFPAAAQVATATNETFTPDNAILDTSVPFAIGASEARQELRGSFGWPTFQEGLVEGVYFRFDPDGYARFAPTPRLDTDVFEVICRPRTFSCMGRKGMLSVILNSRGQLQLEIDGATPNDQFFVVDGVMELQVPGRILQPLDPHLEALLSAGGELVARRGPENGIDRVSLTGFAAVAAYLRWIGARQDYSVLPRNWPVPNSIVDASASGLTQAINWQTSRPLPQNRPILAAQGVDPAGGAGTEVIRVRQELNALRQLLLDRDARDAGTLVDTAPVAARPSAGEDGLLQLEQAAVKILRDLEALKAQQLILTGEALRQTPPGQFRPAMSNPAQAALSGQDAEPQGTGRIAAQLEYLMTEIGLDPQTALMLVQLRSTQQGEEPVPASVSIPAEARQSDAIADILRELQAQLDTPVPMTEAQAQTGAAIEEQTDSADYMLLTDYFRSVFSAGDAEAMQAQ